jgi:hypothetical protein
MSYAKMVGFTTEQADAVDLAGDPAELHNAALTTLSSYALLAPQGIHIGHWDVTVKALYGLMTGPIPDETVTEEVDPAHAIAAARIVIAAVDGDATTDSANPNSALVADAIAELEVPERRIVVDTLTQLVHHLQSLQN